CDMIRTVRKIAPAIKAAVDADGINIGMNNEQAAGQEVFHAHMHVIPRFDNDGVYKPAQHITYATGEMEKIAEEIRTQIQGRE
ncbi:MAG TPA: HIT family protein, partial [Candidatus Paceibacterota bacterium]